MQVKRYRVIGRVQGVGFRYFVYREAANLSVDGWVRNCVDGSVEALARGSTEDLERFKRCLQEGPSFSNVTSVSEFEVDDENVAAGFSIRRDGV
jgi:acylphosphatase